jgi:hypothetical protein
MILGDREQPKIELKGDLVGWSGDRLMCCNPSGAASPRMSRFVRQGRDKARAQEQPSA